MREPGRWHHAGQPAAYLADSLAAALLEVCVHTSACEIPPDFTLLKIEAAGVRLSQVPSAIVPETADYLLNPLHTDARKFDIAGVIAWPFDVRLKK